MPRTLSEVIADLPLEQQRNIEARAAILIDEELTLRDIRKARELTQVRVGDAFQISQDGVSHIEKCSDLLLSALRSYVEAMGGKLRLVAEFPDRSPVIIAGLDPKDSGEVASKRDFAETLLALRGTVSRDVNLEP